MNTQEKNMTIYTILAFHFGEEQCYRPSGKRKKMIGYMFQETKVTFCP